MLLCTLLIILSGICSAYAEHVTCSWRPFTKPPWYSSFFLYCIADLHDIGSGQAEYHCNDGTYLKIADFGKLRPGVLEWGTPCGGGGWAFGGKGGVCIADIWVLCLGDTCNGSCFYMKSFDDCEWPALFNISSAPKSVELWYYNGWGF